MDWLAQSIYHRNCSVSVKSLMAQWLMQQRLRDMKCILHDLDVMGFNDSQVKRGLCSTSMNLKESK